MPRSYRPWLFGVLLAGVIAVPAVLAWPDPAFDAQLPLATVKRAPLHRIVRSHKAEGIQPPEEESPVEDPQPLVVSEDGLEQLGRREIEGAMAQVRARVLSCRDVERYEGMLTAKLIIAHTGVVQSAAVLPPLDRTPTAACVQRALKSAAFPRFRGTVNPLVELTYPFLFKPE